jgi:murein DD-endopeptidase MepM/ murein hydrolase activator NlpD
MKSSNIYRLPFDLGLGLKPHPAPNHSQHPAMFHALDFAMPIGTPVYAALDGVVKEVKKDSDEGGPDRSFVGEANLVRILHENDELTEYVHLMYRGAMVNVGEPVKEGELIGFSGETGYCTYPHLHFAVLKDFPEKPYSVIPNFKLNDRIFTMVSPEE